MHRRGKHRTAANRTDGRTEIAPSDSIWTELAFRMSISIIRSLRVMAPVKVDCTRRHYGKCSKINRHRSETELAAVWHGGALWADK